MLNAFVTLIMGAPHYIYGAIAMAHSLRKTGTNHKIVCMVTADIFNMYESILKTIFDDVTVVSYLKYETNVLKTKKQEEIYSDWKDVSYTKWQSLNLTKYNKICLLDADLIIQKNIDHLFMLRAPAGRFGNNWDSFVNYYDEFKHGCAIHHNSILKGMNNGYLVNGHCIILEPCVDIYKKFMNFMSSGHYKKPHKCLAMVDEYALVNFMIQNGKQWTQIGPEYNCIPWKCKISNIHILHYFNKQKCWQMKRGEWSDIKIWYSVWDSACEAYPEIMKTVDKI